MIKNGISRRKDSYRCVPDFSFGMCHCKWGISHWSGFASGQLSPVFYRHLDIALLAFLSVLALIGLESFSVD